ncbi:MAG: aldo/keto reductase, partial [Chloroflexota bacterium]|nr:aldo/keto reductase [Chloroflexota bacterium]
MNYRLFGRTGVYISPLVLGCMMFGQKTDQNDTCEIIDRAIDHGINFLDTADVYGKGASEEFVGEALKRNASREKIFLATKVNGRMSEHPNHIGNSRLHII